MRRPPARRFLLGSLGSLEQPKVHGQGDSWSLSPVEHFHLLADRGDEREP
jgi:hypothetical protein